MKVSPSHDHFAAYSDCIIAQSRFEKNCRLVISILLSVCCTLLWFVYVSYFNHWDRISNLGMATLTMVFGSVVAGATPQGGGVVAFPVFTKIFDTPPEVARTFSLCIQSVGMTAGAAWILINRKPIDWRTLFIVAGSSIVGLVATRFSLTLTSEPFRPAIVPASYVKITFTFLLVATAFVVYEVSRNEKRQTRFSLPILNGRVFGALVLCGLMGGAASGLVGSGADVFLYMAAVLFFSVDPKVGVPTSVICMALVSIAGMALFAFVDGQFFVGLDAEYAVVSVGGLPVAFEDGRLTYGAGAAAPQGRFDLFGLWLAAVPVVVWGAPLGTLIASWLSSRNLVRFVTLLAISEGLTTVVFLKPLRSDPYLVVYLVVGVTLTIRILRFISSRRERIFRL